jgi:hypothetical protein
MHDVFISYKRKNDQCQKDENFALNLYQKLTDQGASCFLDQESMEKGLWNQQLGDNIWHAKFFIMIMTPHYFQSNNCKQEYHLALAKDAEEITIIPILLEACDFKTLYEERSANPLISIFEHIDFTESNKHEQAYEKLCKFIFGKGDSHQQTTDNDKNDPKILWKHYPCMIDRHRQYRFFFNKVNEQLKSPKKHAICIFHGDANDALDRFCDCIHDYHWTSKYKSDTLNYRYVDAPESTDDPKTYEELMTRVFISSSYDELYTKIQQNVEPVLISSEIQMDIYSKDLRPFKERIKHFVHFWKSLPVHHTSNILMTCLSIVYTQQPSSPKKFQFFKRKKSIKDAMIKHLKDNYAEYLADEMHEINHKHIRKWINHLVVNLNAGDRDDFTQIDTYMKEKGGVPMHELRSSSHMTTILDRFKTNKMPS